MFEQLSLFFCEGLWRNERDGNEHIAFTSAAEVWGQKVLALVLTGMGSDSLRGSQAIAAAGGSILAQDEASSVVWGMPGQVAHAGVCSALLPLNDIAAKLTRLFTGDTKA